MRDAVCRHGLAICLALGTVLAAGGSAGSASAQSEAPLTAADRIDIQQLVARYSYFLDAAPSDGQGFADLFVTDGVLVIADAVVAGHSRLAEMGTNRISGARTTLAANIVLEGRGDRATGRVYVLEIRENETAASPGVLSAGGHFQDEYVRTPVGWRFARRQFFPSRLDHLR